MQLSRAVALFIKSIQASKAKATVAAYESDLMLLVGHSTRNSVLQFTPELLRNFFVGQSALGLSMSTLHRRMAVVSEFAKWGQQERLWLENPMVHIERVRRPKHLPRPFTRDEIERLLTLELPPVERALPNNLGEAVISWV